MPPCPRRVTPRILLKLHMVPRVYSGLKRPPLARLGPNLEPTDTMATDTPAGLDGQPVIVHKKDAEGALIIGSLSGRVIQPIMEQPEWAEGLVVALLSERHEFYMTRLGRAPNDKDEAGNLSIAF
jgi:hypothetical protein